MKKVQCLRASFPAVPCRFESSTNSSLSRVYNRAKRPNEINLRPFDMLDRIP
jgi:hypothetical protein